MNFKFVLTVLLALIVNGLSAQFNSFLSLKVYYNPEASGISLEQKEKLLDVLSYLDGAMVDKIVLSNGQPIQDIPNTFELRYDNLKELFAAAGIQNLEKNIQAKPSYVNSIGAGNFDVITVNYSRAIKKAEKYREKVYTEVEREVLLRNEGFTSTSKSSKITCDQDTTIFNQYDTKLTLPKCMVRSGLIFKEYPAQDYKRLKLNLTAEGDEVNLVSIFRLVTNTTFPKSALLDIQKSKCAEKFELTLKRYDLNNQGFTNGKIVESMVEFSDFNHRYKLVEDGIYILSHKKETEQFKINVDVPSKYKIESGIVNLTCLGTTYIGKTKKNSVEITFPYPYYTPQVKIKIVDPKTGLSRESKSTPISALKGSGSSRMIEVINPQDGKSQELMIFENYKWTKVED
jgi:hypothetical protein